MPRTASRHPAPRYRSRPWRTGSGSSTPWTSSRSSSNRRHGDRSGRRRRDRRRHPHRERPLPQEIGTRSDRCSDVRAWIDTWNDDPKPFVKTADQILDPSPPTATESSNHDTCGNGDGSSCLLRPGWRRNRPRREPGDHSSTASHDGATMSVPEPPLPLLVQTGTARDTMASVDLFADTRRASDSVAARCSVYMALACGCCESRNMSLLSRAHRSTSSAICDAADNRPEFTSSRTRSRLACHDVRDKGSGQRVLNALRDTVLRSLQTIAFPALPFMELLGLLSNPKTTLALSPLVDRARSEVHGNRSRKRRPALRIGLGIIPDAIVAVLRDADEHGLRVRDIHTAVEDLLRQPVPSSSVKNCLAVKSRGADAAFQRISRGCYRLR